MSMTRWLRGGLFITFEGTDGSGKTTQMNRLLARLERENYGPVKTTEPGGTPIGQQIRRILLDPANTEMNPAAELLLYFASRAQNVAQVIRPAMEAGRVVVCDRFTDSTLAYQGGGRGLDEAVIGDLHRITCGTLQPDVTIYLDIDLETSLGRAQSRNNGSAENARESRLDDEAVEFHERVRNAYRRLAGAAAGRYRVVDGRPDADQVESAVWRVVSGELEARLVS